MILYVFSYNTDLSIFFFKFKICYFVNENNLLNILSSFSIKKLIKFIIIFISNSFIKRKVKKIFCYSNQIKENYDYFGYKNKPKLYLWVMIKYFFSKKKKFSKNVTISYFGRINPVKGIHILIDALKLLKNYKWNLIIDTDHVEDKKYFINLKNELKKNFPKNINLLNVIIFKLPNS